LGGGEKGHQRAEAAAVDVGRAPQVDDNPAVLGESALYSFPEITGFIAENDAARTIHYQNSIHGAGINLQFHGASLVLPTLQL
jgi:hypothetical protein